MKRHGTCNLQRHKRNRHDEHLKNFRHTLRQRGSYVGTTINGVRIKSEDKRHEHAAEAHRFLRMDPASLIQKSKWRIDDCCGPLPGLGPLLECRRMPACTVRGLPACAAAHCGRTASSRCAAHFLQPASISRSEHFIRAPETKMYFFKNSQNSFAKCCRARSRLYQSRFLRIASINNHFAIDFYKICAPV